MPYASVEDAADKILAYADGRRGGSAFPPVGVATSCGFHASFCGLRLF